MKLFTNIVTVIVLLNGVCVFAYMDRNTHAQLNAQAVEFEKIYLKNRQKFSDKEFQIATSVYSTLQIEVQSTKSECSKLESPAMVSQFSRSIQGNNRVDKHDLIQLLNIAVELHSIAVIQTQYCADDAALKGRIASLEQDIANSKLDTCENRIVKIPDTFNRPLYALSNAPGARIYGSSRFPSRDANARAEAIANARREGACK